MSNPPMPQNPQPRPVHSLADELRQFTNGEVTYINDAGVEAVHLDAKAAFDIAERVAFSGEAEVWEEELNDRETKVATREDAADEREADLDDREGQLRRREDALREWEKQLKMGEEQLDSREEQLYKREYAVEAREEELAEMGKDQDLHEREGER